MREMQKKLQEVGGIGETAGNKVALFVLKKWLVSPEALEKFSKHHVPKDKQ